MEIDSLTVTDAAQASVTSQIYCQRIRCVEDRQATGWPRRITVTYRSGGSGNFSEGAEILFVGPFQPGEVAGKLQLISGDGSTTFLIIQEG